MAYDEALANRFRKALGRRQGITDRRMMGGICFMHHGHMIGGADRNRETGQGHFMFRVGKANQEAALQRPGARVIEMGGRTMSGMISVAADDCDDEALKAWIKTALAFVKTLPPKS